MAQKWIKVPGPGEFRGCGKWVKLEDSIYSLSDFGYCTETHYLPTAEQDEKPTEDSDV